MHIQPITRQGHLIKQGGFYKVASLSLSQELLD